MYIYKSKHVKISFCSAENFSLHSDGRLPQARSHFNVDVYNHTELSTLPVPLRIISFILLYYGMNSLLITLKLKQVGLNYAQTGFT